MVSTGSTGPTLSRKAMLCVTLAPNSVSTAHHIRNWAPMLGDFDAGMVIQVDFQVLQLMQIQHLLSSYSGPAKILWSEPTRSQGSDTMHPRLCIQGFLPKEIQSSLEARVISSSLQEHLRPAPCLVGLLSCLKDCQALKFEVTEAQAAVKFRHLFWDCILTSPQEALIRTEGTAANWQIELSRRMREEPDSCGLKIKWRPSMHDGKNWAQPIAIESQIQAVRVQAGIKCKGRVFLARTRGISKPPFKSKAPWDQSLPC